MMISIQKERWLALVLLLIFGLCSATSDQSLVLDVAPEANQVMLGRNPKPNYLSSPLKMRLASKYMKANVINQSKKRSNKQKISKCSDHKVEYYNKHSSTCSNKSSNGGVCDETANTIYSGVYPVVNVSLVAPNGSKQQFISFIDTGSSDTWIVTKDFRCIDITTLGPLPQKACQFGTLFKNDGGFTNITDQDFSISYFPEGERLNGSMGYHAVEVAGIYVESTEVALVDLTAWLGDGHSSGLFGLAYPSITSAYYRGNNSQAVYDPVFYTMFKEKLVKPVFSLSLDRVPRHTDVEAPAGIMALGGLVPEHLFKRPFTTVPIERFESSDLEFYTITNHFVYGKTNTSKLTKTGKFKSIIDSGTAPNFMPTKDVNALSALFDPPAVYNKTLDYFTVDCNAKAPYAAFIIDGVTMPMDPRDMIVRSLNGIQGYENVCFSAFGRGGKENVDEMLIGEVWQRSYVVAYDIGNTQMHFAPRRPY